MSRPSPKEQLLLGIDLGTSGMKAVAADASGRPLAHASFSYRTSHPEKGAAEQDPADWLEATMAVVHDLTEAVGSERVGAISLSGMIPTLVCLGPDGVPLRPAVTWEDGRAEWWGDSFRADAGPDALYARTGQHVDGRYLLPMYARLRDEEDIRPSSICGAKDFLFAWLTGTLLTDPSTATGFGCFDLAKGDFDLDLGRTALLRSEALPVFPAVAPSGTSLPLGAPAAEAIGLEAGLPVFLGAADSVLGALGLSACDPGDIAYVFGTSTVILQVADAPRFDPLRRYLVTPLWEGGLYGLEMDLVSTGAALAWLAELVGATSLEELVPEALNIDPRDAPLFLPYVGGGEQGALWDPSLRGALAGLDMSQGRGHLARGLLNGILRETRRCTDLLLPPLAGARLMRGAGGPLREAGFRRDLASAARMPVLSPRSGVPDHSALGATLLAARALGIAEESDDDERFERTEPVEHLSHSLEGVFARYDELFALLYSATSARAFSS